jgi:hypothetical protein
MSTSVKIVAETSQAVLAGGPKKYDHVFDNIPRSFFYFEDSAIILAFDADASDVWRSENDGKDWKKVGDVSGKAIDMVAHPFDAEKAVIFSANKEHWSTNNRGKTWKKFKVERPISYRQRPPLSFNAQNKDYALYAGRDCDEINCPDMVRPLGLAPLEFSRANLHPGRLIIRRTGLTVTRNCSRKIPIAVYLPAAASSSLKPPIPRCSVLLTETTSI